MLFVLMGLDRPDFGAEIRHNTRAAHLRFIAENKGMFLYGGALFDDGGRMVGSLMMVELADREALDRFLKKEPYSRAGPFDPFVVRQTRVVVPEPGFLAAELAKEEAVAA